MEGPVHLVGTKVALGGYAGLSRGDLQRYVQQLDNQRVAAVLLSIVALVLVSEIASAVARARIARRA